MEHLCTACLCSGRNLYFIGETGFYQLFTEILNEIQVYDISQVCVRVCWECRANLHRFQVFKETAKRCYTELLQHLHQNTIPTAQPSHLQVEAITNTSYPDVKLEYVPLGCHDQYQDDAAHVAFGCHDQYQQDAHVPLGCRDQDEHDSLQQLDTDIDIKDEQEHCEVTFVNDLKVEEDIIKPTKEKKKKISKDKIKKKIKVKKKRQPSDEPIINSDIDDLDSIMDYHDDVTEKVPLGKEDIVELDAAKEEEIQMQKEKYIKEVIVPPKPKIPRSKEVLAEKPQCGECGKHFSSRKTYRYHLNVLHKGQNRYPCPRCGKVYQWKSNLGRHMRSHKARDAGELYCDMCDKRFASEATYRQHLKVSRRHVSESEFSFTCNECGKKFVNKTRLRDHIDWEHLKKIKFRCQLCNKPFKCHTSLYVHMQNVHRNKEKKDNLCHVCGKSYQNAAKLKYHIVAMHTSETPYQCEQCSAAFGWYSSLYRHVREVHYKMKVQPKKSKKSKKQDILPQLVLPTLHPPPPVAYNH